MKRSVSLILAFTFLVFSFISIMVPGFDAVATSDGIWWLDSVDLIDANPQNNTTTSISDGSSSMNVVSPDSGDVFDASAKWTSPATSYTAGGTITIDISAQIDKYVWNGENDGYIHMGLNYMSFHIAARLDSSEVGYGGVTGRSIDLLDTDGKYKCEVTTDNGTTPIASESRTISAEFPSGYEDGDRISLHVTSKGGLARYNYVWQAVPSETTTASTESTAPDEPTPTPAEEAKTIVLSGKVLGLDGRPMRRMKLDFSAWFDSEPGMLGGDNPDWNLESSTDGRGLFRAEIHVPEEQEKDVQIMMRGELRCILPDGSETYYIVDKAEEHAQENIFASSWFSVDTNDPFYDDSTIIPVNRVAAFYHLPMGAWTFGGREFLPDTFVSNVADIKELAAHSYIYNMLWDAQFVGGYLFEELDQISKQAVRIETNWQSTDPSQDNISHFEPNGNIIRLTKKNVGYDDQARYTILHEYGHYFDVITNDGYYRTYLAGYHAGGRNVNHGGYMNQTTSDSFIEGFATAYAGIVQLIAGMDNPHIAGHIDLGNPGYYVAWGVNGTEEELAIATLLYQSLFSFDTPKEYWAVLKPNYEEFFGYYTALETAYDNDGNDSALARLQQLALAGGLYAMPFGSGDYEYGEPFIDYPIDVAADMEEYNPTRDQDEPFADLMYEIYENGYVDTSKPIEKHSKDLVLGKVADANRPDRQTTLLHSNSFIYLSSNDAVIPESLMLTFRYRGGTASRMLMPVDETMGQQMVYVGLSSQPVEGNLEISIPGGRTIFEEDLEALHDQYIRTVGQSTPLAQAMIEPADLAQEDVIAAPAEGDANASCILTIPNTEEIEVSNQQAGEEAVSYDPDSGFEPYARQLNVSSNNWGFSPSDDSDSIGRSGSVQASKNPLITVMIIIIVLMLLVIAAVVTVLLVARSKRVRTAAIPNLNAFSAPPTNGVQSFCPSCGSALAEGTVFCSNCGQRID